MHMSQDVEMAKYQTELRAKAPPTVQQREDLVAWLDKIQEITMHVVYATAPDSVWPENTETILNFNLLGQPNPPEMAASIPRGLYCVMLPTSFDVKYRDPIARAYAYLGVAPADIYQVPLSVSVALNKPTAHERMAAKMFFRNLILSNPEDMDIKEWASQLID